MSRDRPERPASGRLLTRTLILLVALIAAWLLWSGLYKPLLLGLGAFSCLITLLLARRMGYFDNDVFALNYNLRLIGFWGWISREIVTSSLQVARVVLARRVRVSPQLVVLDVKSLCEVDQALLGNSITLTPGTLTLDVYDNRITVHVLTQKGADDLLAGEMQRRVEALRKD